MTHEAIIEKVKKKYAGADEATIHAVLQTLQDAKVDLRWPDLPSASDAAKRPAMPSKPQHKFVSEHLTLEQYRKLSLKERGAFQRQLKEKNRDWLEQKFTDLQAAWLMVLDGEIIASGESLKDYPRTGQIREIGLRHGKRPFVFINDLLLAIEESGSAWHSTIYDHDYYPTVPLILHNDKQSLALIADLDTGAASSFADYDLLLSHAIIESEEDEQTEGSQHLNQTFEYISKSIIVEIRFSSEEALRCETPIFCVADWNNTPFVRINPSRTALAGRDLFLELKLGVFLDFANRRTTVSAPTTV